MFGDEPQVEYARVCGNSRSISIHSDMSGYRVRAANFVQWMGMTGHGFFGLTARALGPAVMGLGLVMMLIGGWQLFSDRTAASDRPASIIIGIGAGLLLAFVALAIVSHQARSTNKKDTE